MSLSSLQQAVRDAEVAGTGATASAAQSATPAAVADGASDVSGYVPGRINPGQKNILELMETEKNMGLGAAGAVSENTAAENAFVEENGMNPQNNGDSYGIEPASITEDGFGLDGYSRAYSREEYAKNPASHEGSDDYAYEGDYETDPETGEIIERPEDYGAGGSDCDTGAYADVSVYGENAGEYSEERTFDAEGVSSDNGQNTNIIYRGCPGAAAEGSAAGAIDDGLGKVAGVGTTVAIGKHTASSGADRAGAAAREKGLKSDPRLATREGMQASKAIKNRPEQNRKPYVFPSLDLLDKPANTNNSNERQLNQKAAKLEETLRNFNVDARVLNVTQGPAVTRYEIQPAAGVKVSKIVSLADDIALNLEAKSIRMEAPIPGKPAVGIEVENDKVRMVTIREIIESKVFREAKSKISFAVGKDIAGTSIVGNLADMPHMLIAGATGSGKSVCVNSIIASILYKAKPEEVKMVLIDPKVVELSNYNGIPHLLIPVVTEPSKAAAALNWAVAEMDDRYNKFADASTRDLKGYNEHVRRNGEPELVMPEVVIIIDELADLMMSAPSQIEDLICRLAQKARAAGMHLIVATQRPSVDVITGVIKANIPSRIAFAVSSHIDSRTIIDVSGAEKLVGKGDMLYSPRGSGKPLRVQGTFISDDEVNRIIEHVKSQAPEAVYSEEVIHKLDNVGIAASDDEGDDLLEDAIELVVDAGQASVSMLQRRFRIGYNRAARIVEMMEARGIIGPADGSRPRQVLISEEELEEMKN
ncbi:MAG: DNA translocase FtsK [Clostridia bacterium]|nr:DNA translocase FtsK [Clostridia bacterium]